MLKKSKGVWGSFLQKVSTIKLFFSNLLGGNCGEAHGAMETRGNMAAGRAYSFFLVAAISLSTASVSASSLFISSTSLRTSGLSSGLSEGDFTMS